ncbi:nucleoside hydrolase [Streptacidiphilus sp. PAMC 29251]
MRSTTSALVSLLAVAALIPTVSASASTPPSQPQAAPQQADHTQGTRKVILDSDMGELNDDAVAMFMLAKSPSVDFLGVTTVSGNTWAEEGTADALSQLQLIGRSDIPVVQGSTQPLLPGRQDRLAAENALYGKAPWTGAFESPEPAAYNKLPQAPYGGYAKARPLDTAAVDFIVDQVKRSPHQITFFEVGPATNLALAVRTHPEIVPLIKQVIYMGGSFDRPGNITPAAEFNFWFDPDSARIALRTPFAQQTIVTDDVSEKVLYTKAQYDAITAGKSTPIKKEFKALQGPQFASDPNYSSPIWDAITAAIFLDPGIVKTSEQRYVDVDSTFGPDYGRALGYNLGEFDKPANPAGTQLATLVMDLNLPRFWNLYTGLLSKP